MSDKKFNTKKYSFSAFQKTLRDCAGHKEDYPLKSKRNVLYLHEYLSDRECSTILIQYSYFDSQYYYDHSNFAPGM